MGGRTEGLGATPSDSGALPVGWTISRKASIEVVLMKLAGFSPARDQ